jgi:hypothetical protein
MKWSTQKQLSYGTVFLLIIIIIVGIPTYFYFFNRPATCFDNKKNQNETGRDCGGVCSRACQTDVIEDPIVLWARAFPIANGKSNLVAYLQNPNIDYISESFTYVFNVFDEENVLIGSREGMISAPYDKNFVVFEQAFDAGKRSIGKVTFDITSKVKWNKSPSQKTKFGISSDEIISVGGIPTLTSTITNKTIENYSNFYVVAIVYDVYGNATVVSRTLVDELKSNGKVIVVFTWPQLTDLKYSKIELLPRI